MADYGKEQSYYKSGEKIDFYDIVRLTQGVLTGLGPGITNYTKQVMESAADRRTRTPIYRLNKDVMSSLGADLNYSGARYPKVKDKDQSNSAILLNPRALNFSGRPMDAEWIQKVIDHEMFHDFQGKNPGLTEKIANYVTNSGWSLASPARGYVSAGEALIKSGYGRDVFDVETQAHLGSKTMPDLPNEYIDNTIPKVIELPFRFKDRDMQVSDPRVAEEFQRTIYPILPQKMQQRFKSSFPPDVSTDMPKGFAKSALDSFMSIIGLAKK